MSFPQLGYQYMRPLYPSDRQSVGGTRSSAEISQAGTLSNVLSSMYGAPYAAAGAAQAYGAFLPYSAELPIFPQRLPVRYEGKPGVQHAAFSHPHPAFYPYGQYQHRKNPYPTKGEKIMLAIITKMTLTQVSTWFANARRRLKKENKMTWAPRSRTDEEGNHYEKHDTEDIESKEDLDDPDNDFHSDSKTDIRSDSEVSDGFEDLGVPEERLLQSVVIDRRVLDQGPQDKTQPECGQIKLDAIPPSSPQENNIPATHKPKIWSLAETATAPDNPRKSPHTGAPVNSQPGIPQHRLIACPGSRFQGWTGRAFSAQQLSLLNSAHFLQGLSVSHTIPGSGCASFTKQGEAKHSTDAITDRPTVDLEKKLPALSTAFQPVQRRSQNQLDAAVILSALSSS
ncbi:hypothetical protein GDO86_008466 [Hymenochirus boettgeri]|uniref:Homeobox domain-containing protein n=1 Tax=Hymenochirus boettgeri TaxID=247094 RepID=A0A8T2J379_9PIPI|nr:hypothetical protein GDO86_008466 [Hymenochirus boettgeri]